MMVMKVVKVMVVMKVTKVTSDEGDDESDAAGCPSFLSDDDTIRMYLHGPPGGRTEPEVK